ncbi:hypothetical protein MK805_10590 [Shimazuella sp. AN120528]|nr:hypothetical protein [Shimazuella soli]
MNQSEWRKFGKLVIFVAAFSIGQLVIWKLLAPVQVVFTINGFVLDLTKALHLIESVLIYSAILYVLLKKYGFWEKIFGSADLVQSEENNTTSK